MSRSARRAHLGGEHSVFRLTLMVGGLLLAATACDRSISDLAPGVRLEMVRLDAESFQLSKTGVHEPEASIGDETREVVLAPRTRRLAEGAVRPEPDGSLRIPLRADEQAPVDLDLADRLRVTLLSGLSELNVAAKAEDDSGWRRVSIVNDWAVSSTSETGAPETVSIPRAALEPRGAAPQKHYRVAVDVLEPLPAVLESQPLRIGSDVQLEIGFGVAALPGQIDSIFVEFEASLSCADRASTLLFRTGLQIQRGRNPGWQERVIAPRVSAGQCSLRLESSAEAARLGIALWATPRVLRPAADEPPANLVVISLDTLRADHLSGYGYPRETTPQLDRRLIAEGTTFTQASSTFPLTHIAHLSLFSGLYPSAQPSLGTTSRSSSIQLLAEKVRDAGYTTGAFTENGYVSTHLGFSKGFLQWIEYPLRVRSRGERIFADGRAFLHRQRDRPFFLFLHTYKVHIPYLADPQYAHYFAGDGSWQNGALDSRIPEKQRDNVDAYDRAIRQLDDQLAEFLDELDALGLAERTYVVVVSDHGEAFGEHGVVGHGMAAHEEQLRVPWVIRGPGVPANRRIDSPVSLVDFAPTLLDLLGLAPLDQGQGRSLREALVDGAEIAEQPIFFSWLGGRTRGMRLGSWKLMAKAKKTRIYDLDSDPNEEVEIASAEPLSRIGPIMQAHLAEGRRMKLALQGRDVPPSDVSVSPGMVESLRGLGYVE